MTIDLVKALNQGQSVSVLGMEASGHNTLVEELINKVAGSNEVVVVDCRLFNESETTKLKDLYCFSEVAGRRKNRRQSLINLVEKLNGKKKLWVHIKNIENALDHHQEMFRILRGISRLNKQNVGLVFSGNHHSLRKINMNVPHINIMMENIVINKPFDKKSCLKILNNYLVTKDLPLTKAEENYYYELSGGNPNIIKGMANWLNSLRAKPENNDINELINKSEIEVRLGQIYRSLNVRELETLVGVDNREEKLLLTKIGMISEKGMMFSPLFEAYFKKIYNQTREQIELKGNEVIVNGKNVDQLFTNNEYLLLGKLINQTNKLVTRDQIFDAVWKKNLDYYSDWSLDQLVRRLRNKLKRLKMEDKLLTVKGRGLMWYEEKE